MKRKDISSFEAERVARFLRQRHEMYLQDDEFFEVSGYSSRAEVFSKVILRNEDESLFYPVECRIEVPGSGLDGPSAAMELVLDFQDYYFGRYLREDRDIYLTVDWSSYQFDEHTVEARGQRLNRKLEQMADQWLAGERPDPKAGHEKPGGDV